MDGNWGEEKQKDRKKDLEVSSLPNREPKGIYQIKETAFVKREKAMEGNRKACCLRDILCY